MGVFAKLFRWHKAKKAVQEEIERLDATPPADLPSFLETGGGSLAVLGSERRMGEITGVYEVVHSMLDDAIKLKKQTQASAMRISESIGLPPETTFAKHR